MKSGKIGVNLGRKGSPRKLQKSKKSWVKEKRCPDCGEKFHTRTALKEHIVAATDAERRADALED